MTLSMVAWFTLFLLAMRLLTGLTLWAVSWASKPPKGRRQITLRRALQRDHRWRGHPLRVPLAQATSRR